MVHLDKVVLQGFKSFKRNISIPMLSGFTVFTGANGTGKCLDYNSLVQLEDGSLEKIGDIVEENLKSGKKEIEDGVIADGYDIKVLSVDTKTLKMAPRPVKACIKRTSPQTLIKLKTRSGRGVLATEYHPLFVLKDNKIESIKSEDIKEGAKIAVPRKIPVNPKTKIFSELLDLIEASDRLYVPWNPVFVSTVKKIKKLNNFTLKGLAKCVDIPLVCLKNLLNGQSINFANIVKILRFAKMPDNKIIELLPYLKSRTTKKTYKIPWENSPEFARFLGYLIAEGRLTKSNQIWFTNGTQEIVEDYVELARKLFEVKPSVNEYKANCWDVLIYSQPLIQLLTKFGMTKKTTEHKKLTNLFMAHSSENELGEFLDGLYSGDGYISKNSIEITTKSKMLGFCIENILLRLGILFLSKYVVKTCTNSGYSGTYKKISVYGSKNSALFKKYVNLTHPQKRARLENLIGKSTNPNVDLIELNPLIREVTKDLKIGVKKNKKKFPRLDSYYYNQCTPSVYGVNYLIKNVFLERCQQIGHYPHSLAVLQLLATSDIFWDEIVSVEKIPAGTWVYDLSIEGDHNFIANNIIVHNSNVAESVSFVFGLGSRSLRARKAHELVFAGSKKKPASDYANVTLHFNNSSGQLPVDDREVTVARKLNKAGVSIYKLNGKTVTRQQMLDLFTQARLSPGGHNIIHQGDVTQVIEMDAVQRRSIIDEISGIAEYDEKKIKAERELDRVAEKLREAEIILNERTQTIERLKGERDAAMKHKQLQEELDLVRNTVIWKDFSGTENNLSGLNKEIDDREKEAEQLEREIKEFDSKLDEEEKNLDTIASEVMNASGQIELTKKIEKLRSEIERKNDKIDSNDREMDRVREMMDKLSTGSSSKIKSTLNFSGVHGIVSELVIVPPEYAVAVDVAAGSHMRDIVVDTTETGVKCIKYLKENKLGRARFIPLNRIRVPPKKQLPKGAIGWLSELIHHEPKYSPMVDYIFSTTACVSDIDKAKEIAKKERVRMVTLDGDMMESSGAMVGGHYKKKPAGSGYLKDLENLQKENKKLLGETNNLKFELDKLVKKQKPESPNIEVKKARFDEKMKKFRENRKEAYEKKLVILQRLNDAKIKRAKLEAKFENLGTQWDRCKEAKNLLKETSMNALKNRQKEIIMEIEGMGPVNMKAIEAFESIRHDFEDFKEKVDKIIQEKSSIEDVVKEIESKRREVFNVTLSKIARYFKEVYVELTHGEADLSLDNPDSLDSGLIISASPSGKKLLNIDAMSGGEKTLTALAFLFAVQRHKPSPFYILDEADAALDKANTKKFTDLIKKQSQYAQFILVSHNDELIKEADQVYGVSMEDGESKIIGVKLPGNN